MVKFLRERKLLFVFVLPLVILAAYVLFFQGGDEVRVLIFSKTEGFRHASIEPGIRAIEKLGRENGFHVDATEDAAAFTQRNLKNYQAVVFLNTTGDVLNDTQQVELQRFIQAGGGFVGVHAAADTEYEWPWYNALVGAYFDGHPGDPNVREGVLHVADPDHPSTESLPATWTRTDEWYDYRNFKGEKVHVLLNVDETSYKRPDEQPAPEPRPIAWYRAFDGGRTFYTGLGHTAASYSEPLFLEHLLGGIRYAIGSDTPVDYGQSGVMPQENRFTQVILVDSLTEPMELDYLPGGRILFVERRGDVHIYDTKSDTLLLAGEVDVFTGQEDGLLGVAVDPHYAENHWVYLFYSPPEGNPRQHVSRFVLEDSRLDLASEKVLLEIPTQRQECCHAGGSLEFGPDESGLLYISTGDNTNPFASDGYAPIDEREGRSAWDAQRTSANTNDLRGKILRIRPEPDGTYSIPDGNLFPKDGSQGRPEIYVMGNRNPYRIAVDAHTGYLYWGEIGPDAGEDSTGRGPRGYDEINQARSAGNYGWPYFIANNKPYYDYDFATQTSDGRFDPRAPINNSPNNTGARELPPAQPAFIWYPYGPSSTFPLVGEGGRSAMAGGVYYADDYTGAEHNFPEYYDGKLFIYEWMRGWIMAVTMDENGDFVRMERFMPSTSFSNPIDLLFSSNGTLYVLEYGPIWNSGSPQARLSRIDYTAGNRAPVARIAANHTVGGTPLTVQLSGNASTDADADPLEYAWQISGTDAVQADEANATVTLDEAGTYTALLTVTDPSGAADTAKTKIYAGNEPPRVTITLAGNRRFYWEGRPVRYDVSVTDAEDGTLADGGLDPRRVTFTYEYLPEGTESAQPVRGHRVMTAAALVPPGKKLIDASDCSACHQQTKASIGPAYVDIARRYQGNAEAADRLTTKIIEGGSGVWGERAMAAHPQLSEKKAEKMVMYILSLAEDSLQAPRMPLKGTFIPKVRSEEERGGRYVLTATYTDRGGNGVGPVTARAVITLQPPRMAAATYDEATDGQRIALPEDTPGPLRGTEVFLGNHGAQATYEAIDLTGVEAVTATFAVAPGYTTGGWVDVYLDGLDGEKLGTLEVAQHASVDGMEKVKDTLPIPAAAGVHDLTFVYRNEAEDGIVCLGLWFDFRREEQPLPQ